MIVQTPLNNNTFLPYHQLPLLPPQEAEAPLLTFVSQTKGHLHLRKKKKEVSILFVTENHAHLSDPAATEALYHLPNILSFHLVRGALIEERDILVVVTGWA